MSSQNCGSREGGRGGGAEGQQEDNSNHKRQKTIYARTHTCGFSGSSSLEPDANDEAPSPPDGSRQLKVQDEGPVNTVLTFPLQADCLLGQFVLLDLLCADDNAVLLPRLLQMCLLNVDRFENICADKMRRVMQELRLQPHLSAVCLKGSVCNLSGCVLGNVC